MAKAKKIKSRPSLTVSGLGAPTRGSNNRVMTASWKVPSGLTNSKNTSRAEGLDVLWSIGTSAGTYRVSSSVGTGTTSRTINLDGITLGRVWHNRNSFYPKTAKKLNSVTVSVRAKNSKGAGKYVSQTRKFSVPRTPTLSELSFNTENGVISTTIETDAGADYQERLDTKYAITVTSPFLNDGKPTNTSDSYSTSTSFSINYDAQDYMNLDYDQYIKVEASAYARGYAGDSKPATRTEYISYPAQATIEGVEVSGRDATSKCTIRINPNSTTEHPVDKVRLQVAADVTYDDANDIPANDWEDTDITDNANCTALSIATSELLPSRGNHTFVRVVTYHLHEGVLYRYSEPRRVEELETPTAPSASINIEILEAHTGADGKSAVVRLGWNKDGQDDYTGTELSWSDAEDTWKSTDEPSHHEFTWSDGELTYGGVTYHDSAEITIKGLSEGEKYFIKARRYLEADNEEYSPYSNTATIFTSEIPESIVASCSRYIADGDPLSVYWTFAGNGIQTRWQIVRVTNGELDGTVIAEGEGSAGATQISAERLSELATDNTLTFIVQASTGSGFVSSEEHSVSIIEKPTLEITGSSLVHVHEEDVQTYTGDIVEIDNSRGVLNTKSLTVSLEPIQNLNGYDKPWSGGNGKNKAYADGNGMLSTSDGYTVATNRFWGHSDQFVPVSGSKIATRATRTLALTIYFYDSDKQFLSVVQPIRNSETAITTLQSNVAFIRIGLNINGTEEEFSSDLFSKYQIQAEFSDTVTAYEPYSNECPIYGRTEVVTQRTGVNVWDEEWENGYYSSTNGAKVSDSNYFRAKNLIPVKPNTSYYFVAPIRMEYFDWDADGNFLRRKTNNIQNAVFTTSADCYFLTFDTYVTATTYNNDISINYPSTDTEYHAYEGTTYTTALGRTVYGGTLDVVSGELVVTHGYVDLGDLSWSYSSTSGQEFFYHMGLDAKSKGSSAELSNAVCDSYGQVGYDAVNGNNGTFGISRDGTYLKICDTNYSSGADFKTAMSGHYICYELATPQTYQLTPQEVELLTGTNNVWSDASDTELTTAEVLVDGDFLRTNDLSITCESNQLCDLITIVTSQGASGQFPQGVLMQAAGDTVHSDIYRPTWTNGSASINLPTGLNFWDGGKYTASIVGVDRATGLRSPEVTLDIPVYWTNQAVSPVQVSYTLTTDTSVDTDEAYYEKVGNAYVLVVPEGNENPQEEGWYTQDETSFVTLTVIDEKDSDGDHRQAVQIALTPPTGSSETDVYDIYRMDIENPSLIGEGFPLTYTAIDEHAPFGKDVELRYRIAIRTVDGDVAFSDIEYTADCENIRFDWAGGSLELPYGNSIGDSFSKDADIRKHMNGVSNGYWNRGVERKSSLSSSIIKIVQPRDIERARQLARYAGAVFVRLPNGSAFEADVQVTDLSIKNEAITAVAFDATEIGLTNEFSLPTPFRMEDE